MFNSGMLTGMEPTNLPYLTIIGIRKTPGTPVCCGYGQLLAKYASGVPVMLYARAAIDWSANGVALETSEGTVKASAAIVTVSNNVLNFDAIRSRRQFRAGREVREYPRRREKIAIAFDKDVLGLSDALFSSIPRPRLHDFRSVPSAKTSPSPSSPAGLPEK